MTTGRFDWHWTARGWKRIPHRLSTVKKNAKPPKRKHRKRQRSAAAATVDKVLTFYQARKPSLARAPGRPLTRTAMHQADAHAMIRRRARAVGVATAIGNHSFRATGITAYLKNGGTLEKAASMANHASTRTTQLYDRRRDEMSLDEVERISI
jgi:site-specific recombinase XerD